MDDDALLAAVKALVLEGEYLDTLLGLPGVDSQAEGAFRMTSGGDFTDVHTRER